MAAIQRALCELAAGFDAVVSLGGESFLVYLLTEGRITNVLSHNKCAAGSGEFFVQQIGRMGLGLEEAIRRSFQGKVVPLASRCSVHCKSDITHKLNRQEATPEDILRTLHDAMAGKVVALLEQAQRDLRRVLLIGGLTRNGAMVAALLALRRSSRVEGRGNGVPPLDTRPSTLLLALASAEMKLVGRFTCSACKLACAIDRFEVAGRRFPFGGRCSLYENVWKRKSRTAPAPDLVEQRARLLFGSIVRKPASKPPREQMAAAPLAPGSKVQRSTPINGQRAFKLQRFLPSSILHPPLSPSSPPAPPFSIGIPRALTTHSLFPLYSTFFSGLGLGVVLSNVDPRGELKSYSGFCFPAQIAHGALLDLAERDVGLAFLPHIVRMPQDNPCRDSYLCPVTQAGPYFLAKAFPGLRFLSPVLDFTRGYEASSALVEMAVQELGKPRGLAGLAWAAAVRAQRAIEGALGELGQQALARAVQAGKPAILLAGRSYNAFTPEGSQSVGKKLSSMGVTVIPADCLAPVRQGPTVWHAANQILNAVALAKQHPNLFLLCVSNFSCTIDAFTHAMLASELGAKPCLILEIDAHTADAGVQTRLEAFLDIVPNYRETQVSPCLHRPTPPHQPPSPTRRNRRLLHDSRRRPLRQRLLYGVLRTLHHRAAPAGRFSPQPRRRQ
ncbi:MAG: acyl-CoA dehydratase activase-related protein [Verrucomicrobiota bacterium]